MALPPPPPIRKGSNPPPPPGPRPQHPPNPPAPPAPRQTHRGVSRLIYASDVPITVQGIIDRARAESLHPYAAAYRMDDPMPWGFAMVLWIEERTLETRKRLGIDPKAKLPDEMGGEILADMCAYLNAKVPKFAHKPLA